MAGLVITVAQQKGGAGKTTLAIHLAAAFAKMGKSTLLFDTDPQGTCRNWHALRKASDIGLIATSGWRLTKDLQMAVDNNDIVVIDSPPHAEMDAKAAIRAADLVILPLQPSPADLWAVRETAKMVAGEKRPALAVLNRVVPRASITDEIRAKLALMDIEVAETAIGSRVIFATSMEKGNTVLDEGKNPSADEVMALAQEIAQKLGLTPAKAAKARKGTAAAVRA